MHTHKALACQLSGARHAVKPDTEIMMLSSSMTYSQVQARLDTWPGVSYAARKRCQETLPGSTQHYAAAPNTNLDKLALVARSFQHVQARFGANNDVHARLRG